MRKNREFLMLAKTYNPERHEIGGWYVSEKRDGQRCFWDGGVSRGVPKQNVPWANTLKDERYQNQQIATGLWTRYSNIIHAPKWFLNKLPTGVCLDGELYLDRGQFQETRKIVSTLEPDERWHRIRFLIFETPAPQIVFQDGRINNTNFKLQVSEDDCKSFFQERNATYYQPVKQFGQIAETLEAWRDECPPDGLWFPMLHVQLPYEEDKAQKRLYNLLNRITEIGGEGLMLRCPLSQWDAYRTPYLLKVKKMQDAEGVIVGYTWGVEGKEGKLLGLMGSAIVKWNGQKFKLSGFKEDERWMCIKEHNDFASACEEGKQNPGEVVHNAIHNPLFPRGTHVRFRYAGLTTDGIPREARYYR